MSEPKYSTSAKIFKWLAYFLMGSGLVLTMFGISSLVYPVSPPFLDVATMIVLGVTLLLFGSLLLALAQQGLIKPEFDAITLMRCTARPDCKYTKARKFERGDYVFKELDQKCEKCNSPLEIAAIFEVERNLPKEKKENQEELQKKEESSPKSPPKDIK
ncbi:MAG: hypothetical protein ACTSRS_14525 [Candidatus Helarchaeota archaeon]